MVLLYTRTWRIVYPNAVDVTCFSRTLDRVGEHFNIPILQGVHYLVDINVFP